MPQFNLNDTSRPCQFFKSLFCLSIQCFYCQVSRENWFDRSVEPSCHDDPCISAQIRVRIRIRVSNYPMTSHGLVLRCRTMTSHYAPLVCLLPVRSRRIECLPPWESVYQILYANQTHLNSIYVQSCSYWPWDDLEIETDIVSMTRKISIHTRN